MGPMAELLCALEGEQTAMGGRENLKTLLLVEACHQSAKNKEIIDFKKLCKENGL